MNLLPYIFFIFLNILCVLEVKAGGAKESKLNQPIDIQIKDIIESENVLMIRREIEGKTVKYILIDVIKGKAFDFKYLVKPYSPFSYAKKSTMLVYNSSVSKVIKQPKNGKKPLVGVAIGGSLPMSDDGKNIELLYFNKEGKFQPKLLSLEKLKKIISGNRLSKEKAKHKKLPQYKYN